MWRKNIVSYYNLFIPLMKRKFLSLLELVYIDLVYIRISVVRSGCVYDILTMQLLMIYLRNGCIYDILTKRVYLWYTYDAVVYDILTKRVCLWYTYGPGVLMMYFWCIYFVHTMYTYAALLTRCTPHSTQSRPCRLPCMCSLHTLQLETESIS